MLLQVSFLLSSEKRALVPPEQRPETTLFPLNALQVFLLDDAHILTVIPTLSLLSSPWCLLVYVYSVFPTLGLA